VVEKHENVPADSPLVRAPESVENAVQVRVPVRHPTFV